MSKVISKDGTEIAYEKKGTGPAVILVNGALTYRSFGSMDQLADLLSQHFTVYTYDRRGRGESSNEMPFTVDREVEDIDALIQKAGGSAFVFGISSGACLALEAARILGNQVKKLAMYEPPYDSEDNARKEWKDYRKQLAQALAEGRRSDAVELFMKLVETPPDQVAGMRNSPMWPMLEAVAPTLAYDAAAIGEDRSVPIHEAAAVAVPVLVINGTVLPFMASTARTLAMAIPHSKHLTLEGQSHDVDQAVLAPVLVEFFTE